MGTEHVAAVISTYQRQHIALPFVPAIFLVTFADGTADTLMVVISDWIEPGTTVISGC
jgi:hypothetical protein